MSPCQGVRRTKPISARWKAPLTTFMIALVLQALGELKVRLELGRLLGEGPELALDEVGGDATLAARLNDLGQPEDGSEALARNR